MNKYDGYKFNVYRFDPTDSTSLAANSVNTLFVDSKGRIWAGTFDGLCVYNPSEENFKRYQTSPSDSGTISNNYINAISEDKNGMIWVCTALGLNKIDPVTDSIQRFLPSRDGWKSPGAFVFNCITNDPRPNSDYLWIGTNGRGLNRLNITTNEFKRYFKSKKVDTLNKFYSNELMNELKRFENTIPDVSITEAVDSINFTKKFEIKNSSYYLIVSLGEGIDEMADYGWIEDPSGNIVWESTVENSRYAGGSFKNRINCDVVYLTAGNYSLRYKTDDSHSFGMWNSVPPKFIYDWGIKIWKINDEDADNINVMKKNFVKSDLISGNTITSVHSSKNENDKSYSLWVGIQGGGVNRIILNEDANYLSSITKIKYYLPSTFSKSNPPTLINDINSDKDNSVWIGTDKGIFVLNNNPGEEIQRYFFSNSTGGLSSNFITSLHQDRSGLMWIGTANGINKLNKKRFQFNYNPIADNKENNIAFNSVSSFFEDEDGIIWIGLKSGNLVKFNPGSGNIYNTRRGRNDIKFTIGSILNSPHNENELWLGTLGNGIVIFNKKNESIRYIRSVQSDSLSLSSDLICRMIKDSKGKIWIGTQNSGLNKYDPLTKKFTRYTRPNSNVSESSRYLQNRMVWSIEEDTTGGRQVLWVGTVGGSLSSFDVEKEEFKHYFKNNELLRGINNRTITSVYIDKHNTLWVGTYSGGLNKYNRETDTFSLYTVNDGLPNNQINSILEDGDENIWLSTNVGISEFNLKDKTFTNYSVIDGLQGNIYNRGAGTKTRSGILYFGGINGFNFFNPKELIRNSNKPEIKLTCLSVLGDEDFSDIDIYNKNEIELEYYQNYLTFEFAALEYTLPEKNTYKYFLEGIDKNWSPAVFARSASYNNLPPGKYKFMVKAANSDGVWNEIPAQLSLIIIPPWYKTWWFYLLLFSLIIFIVLFTFNYRIQLLRKQKERQIEFSRKLILYQENERHRIASELHDSLGQNMLIIKNEINRISGREKSDPEIENKLSDISDLTLESIREVREIAYHLHPHQLERLGLSKAIESVITRAGKSCDINFNINIDKIDNVFSKEAEINLYRIIQESVNNIVKHSSAKSSSIDILFQDEELRINISDNGKGYKINGYENTDSNNGLGIRGIAERVNLLNGNFNINSKPGSGTTMNISLPLKSLIEK